MNINNNRKKELKVLKLDKLINTNEFKNYLNEIVYKTCIVMDKEVKYILKQSVIDPDVPFCRDDISNHFFNKEKIIGAIMKELKKFKDKKKLNDFLANYNYLNAKNDLQLFKKFLYGNKDIDELIDMINKNCILLNINLNNLIEKKNINHWLLVDKKLLNELKKRGEVILFDKYWGRNSCNKPISSDKIIIDIFKEYYLNN